MLKQITCIILSLLSNAFSQTLIYPDSIVFPQQQAFTITTQNMIIKNSGDKNIYLELVKHNNNVFSFSDSVLLINANDSLQVSISYAPCQNVTDNDIFIFIVSDSSKAVVIKTSGSAVYNDPYDPATFDLFDFQLKNALNALTAGHNSLGYNLARDKMFMEIDNWKVNGIGAVQNTIECVYTGRLALGYIDRTDCQTNYNFNTEHSWPQSTFSQNEPMRSDLYHLYPTDETANNKRANYPFGVVTSSVSWDSGGSKLGLSATLRTVFEPRDIHKGDVSRALFYFVTRYQNYGNFLDQEEETTFRLWNKFDSVSVIESNRNDDIAALQLKRNPFIDHPEFIDRIYSFLGNARPEYAELYSVPNKVCFDTTTAGDSSQIYLYLTNYGNVECIINSFIFEGNETIFTLLDTIHTLASLNYKKIVLSFSPVNGNEYSSRLIINSSGGNDTVYLNGVGRELTEVKQTEAYTLNEFNLDQNYPNPFNPATTIKFSLPSKDSGLQNVSLIVYDVLGNEIAVLLNHSQPEGDYEVTFSAEGLSSGIYFYQLKCGAYIDTKKMLVLK